MKKDDLNKSVAETVFGWTGVFIDRWEDCLGYPPGLSKLEHTPPYSRYMTAAWKVVEGMIRTECAKEFAYWFNGADLWSLPEDDAARLICETAVRMLRDEPKD